MEYAENVRGGKVPACIELKQCVERFFDDLENPDSETNGTYLRIVDQRPTSFLGDMDAIFDLMAWLDEGEIDSIFDAIDAGEMYMTDENLWEALGYAYRFEDSISWAASTVPIIVDPLA